MREISAEEQASIDAAYRDSQREPGNNVFDFADRVKSSTSAGHIPSKMRFPAFEWCDPATIPARPWVFGHHLLRKYVAATFAPGGVGKSTLTIVDALAMVTGRALLGVMPRQPHLRVCIWNGEDDINELNRRVLAVMLHYDISRAEIEGRLFLASGRDLPIKISDDNQKIAKPVIEALIETIRDQCLDVLIIDPFVSAHSLPENDNTAMDAAVKAFALVADRTNCAIDLVHHSRKLNGVDADIDAARGGSAIAGAVRSARVLNPMNAEAAGNLGIPENERRSYVRVDDAKGNFAPPATAKWFKLVSEPLGNVGPNGEPGDWVAVAEPWSPPDIADGLTADVLGRVQDAIEYETHNGVEGCRHDAQATNWAGRLVGDVLGLDPDDKADKMKIKAALKLLIDRKALRVVDGDNGKGRTTKFVHVGERASTP